MALETFKEIVERKGYLVNKEDRKIFEKEIKKSNFGMGYSDMIEFILYDSNDNQKFFITYYCLQNVIIHTFNFHVLLDIKLVTK